MAQLRGQASSLRGRVAVVDASPSSAPRRRDVALRPFGSRQRRPLEGRASMRRVIFGRGGTAAGASFPSASAKNLRALTVDGRGLFGPIGVKTSSTRRNSACASITARRRRRSENRRRGRSYQRESSDEQVTRENGSCRSSGPEFSTRASNAASRGARLPRRGHPHVRGSRVEHLRCSSSPAWRGRSIA